MAAILNSTILDLAILAQNSDSNSLTFVSNSMVLTQLAQKETFTHWILTQLDDGSHLEFYHVGFTHTCQDWIQTPFCIFSQTSLKNTLPPHHLENQTLLIQSDLTWWWQPILKSAILDSATFAHSLWLKLDDDSHLEFCHVGLIHFCFQLWWWQLKNTLNSTHDSGLKLIHSHSNLFILPQLDDGSHLEFCHVGFRHFVFFSQIHSKTLSLHSDSDSKSN